MPEHTESVSNVLKNRSFFAKHAHLFLNQDLKPCRIASFVCQLNKSRKGTDRKLIAQGFLIFFTGFILILLFSAFQALFWKVHSTSNIIKPRSPAEYFIKPPMLLKDFN